MYISIYIWLGTRDNLQAYQTDHHVLLNKKNKKNRYARCRRTPFHRTPNRTKNRPPLSVAPIKRKQFMHQRLCVYKARDTHSTKRKHIISGRAQMFVVPLTSGQAHILLWS